MAKNPALSIIVPCTRPECAVRCLEGIAGQQGSETVEAFVVGDVPDDAPRTFPFPVHWIASGQIHPNTRRNRGIELSSAPRIAILDDDTIPLNGWLERALMLDPGELVVRTGPELPVRESSAAKLAHAVYAGPIGEVSSGHHTPVATKVAWYMVPFSNLITTRKLLERIGTLDESIPWDMDDFSFCHRARGICRFESDPRLLVRHDRYPDSISRFIRYFARLRFRTGVKLVTHPGIYWMIPAVAACALFPLVAAGLLLAVPGILIPGAALYALLLCTQIPRALKTVGPARTPGFLGLTAVVHGVTVSCVLAGLVTGLCRLVTGKNTRG